MAAGRLDVLLGLNAAEFTRGLTKAELDAQKFQKQMASVGASIGKAFGAAFAAVATVQTVRAFTGIIGALDDLDEAAQAAGASSAVALANFRRAALDSGVAAEQLDKALTKINVTMSAAASGDLKAAAAFDTLGIKIRDANGELRKSDEVLKDIADAFAKFRDGPEKSALAVALFGEKVGPRLVALLNQGRQGLEGYNQVTQETLDQAIKLQREFDKLGANVEKAQFAVVGFIATAVNPLIERFNAAITATGDFDIAMNRVFLNRSPAQLAEQIAITEKKLKDLDDAWFFKDARTEQTLVLLSSMRTELGLLNKELAKAASIPQTSAEIGITAPRPRAPTITDPTKAINAAKKAQDDHERYLERLRDGYAGYINKLAEAVSGEEALTEVQKANLIIEQQRFGPLEAGRQELLLYYARRNDAEKEYGDIIAHNARLENEASAARQARQDRIGELTGATQAKRDLEDLILLQEELAIRGDEFLDDFNKATNALAGFSKEVEKADDIGKELGLTFTSALEDAIVDFNSLRDIVKGLEKDLVRIGTRKLVTEPLANWFSDLTKGFGGSGGGGFGSILGAIFGGGQNLAGVFASGSDFVPRDGLAMVHRGERIVTAQDNRSGDFGNRNSFVFNFAGQVSRETMNQVQAAAFRGQSLANRRVN